MFLFIIGLFLIVVAFVGSQTNEFLHKSKGFIILIGFALVGVGLGTSAIRIIQPGEIGVQVLFGRVQEKELYEGLNFVNPLVDVQKITTQTQTYTMSAVHDEGKLKGDDAIHVLSADGLEVTLDITVNYKVLASDSKKIIQDIGLNYEEKIVRPYVRTRIRDNAVNYDAISLFSTKREEFQNVTRLAIEKDFKERGLELQQVLIRNISLPQSVKESIERKITAIQESQRMEYVLQKGRQEAELKRVEAQGTADAQKILSSGLSDKILQYEMIKVQKELVNSQNSKIIVLGGGKGSSPLFFNGDK